MPLTRIDSLDDDRLTPYRHLRLRNMTRYSGRFIAESRPLVQRLVQSDYSIESILIDASLAEDSSSWLPPTIDTYMISHELIEPLLGFQFHRGFLACGIRKPLLPATAALDSAAKDHRWLGVYAVGIQDPENLGVILRTCAALGIQDVGLGPGTADPLSRRVLRVSMGAVFKLRLFEARDPFHFLSHATQAGILSLATSLQSPSQPLENFQRSRPTLILLGNEAFGLPEDLQAACSHRVNIPMELGTDSLNVSVAAGIVLHYLKRLAHIARN